MTDDEEPIERHETSADAAWFGDDVVWFPGDPERRFDPVTDVAVGAGPRRAEWVEAVVEHCAQGLAALVAVDPSEFDAETTAAWAKGVESLRRQATGGGIGVADHVVVAQPFRGQGFFSAKAWL